MNPKQSQSVPSGGALSRVLWVDAMRVLATFLVLMIHAAADPLMRFHELPSLAWWVADGYSSIARIAVPWFFMLSGALLLPRVESLRDFFLKRFRKVLIPMILWSVFYLWWSGAWPNELHGWLRFFVYPTFYHLWFLYALLGVYLCLPLLRAMVVKGGDALAWYFVALWFLVEACLPWLQQQSGEAGFWSLSTVTGYAGYAVLGYALSQRVWRMPWVLGAALVALVCWWVTTSGTQALTSAQDGVLSDVYYDLLSWNMILLSASSFVVAHGLLRGFLPSTDNQAPGAWWRWLQPLSDTSFGVYLIHPLLMGWLASGAFGWKLYGSAGATWLMVPFTALVTYVLSHLAVWLMRQVPFVRAVVP